MIWIEFAENFAQNTDENKVNYFVMSFSFEVQIGRISYYYLSERGGWGAGAPSTFIGQARFREVC